MKLDYDDDDEIEKMNCLKRMQSYPSDIQRRQKMRPT